LRSTHLENSKQAELFTIVKHHGIGSNVLRIVAVTGDQARDAFALAASFEHRVSELEAMPVEEANEKLKVLREQFQKRENSMPVWRVDQIKQRIEAVSKKEIEHCKNIGKNIEALAHQIAEELKTKKEKFYVGIMDVGNQQPNKPISDAAKIIKDEANVPVLIICKDPSRRDLQKPRPVFIHSFVPQEISSKFSAGKWVNHVATFLGGSGGGKPDVASGYGLYEDKMEGAISAATSFVNTQLK